MSEIFNIAFATDRGELKWFTLSSTALSPRPVNEHPAGADPCVGPQNEPNGPQNAPNVLVLPATAGLPFQIELPFDDRLKITRVIPQFVADQYAEVNDTWLFSWSVLAIGNADTPAFQVSGMAFPPEFRPAVLAPGINWRLAVPDFCLASGENQAIKILTPANTYLGIFDRGSSLSRVVADFSMPVAPLLAAHGLGEPGEQNLEANPAGLSRRLSQLLDEPGHLDLSGFRQQILGRSLKISIAALVFLLIGLIGIGHFFLWFESRLAEAAAERTRAAMITAFNQVFPGVPVVDAGSQIRRKIAEAEKSLNEAGSIPNIDWLSSLFLAAPAAEAGIKLTRLTGRTGSFRCQGEARDFTSLEAFRQTLESNPAIAKVAMPESRKSGELVFFTLEATWKR